MFIVWYLAALLTRLHTITPWSRTCSFISHLNSPGSIQPGCHHGAGLIQTRRSLPCPTSTHLLLRRESAHAGKVPCLGAQHLSTMKPSQRLKPAISLLQVAHATTEPATRPHIINVYKVMVFMSRYP